MIKGHYLKYFEVFLNLEFYWSTKFKVLVIFVYYEIFLRIQTNNGVMVLLSQTDCFKFVLKKTQHLLPNMYYHVYSLPDFFQNNMLKVFHKNESRQEKSAFLIHIM